MSARRLFWMLADPFVRAANLAGFCSYEWVNVCCGAWHREYFDALWHFERYGTPVAELPDDVILCGCGYRTAVSEGTIVFFEDISKMRIVFDRDHFDRWAALWYVAISGHVPASHVDAAYRWTKAVYGGSFEYRRQAA